MKDPTRASGAFTLIELLVVVAIIVVLLALLMPGLDKAIDVAETAKCLANFHGISLTTRQYTLAHRGAFMDHRVSDGSNPDGTKEIWWATRLFPFGASAELFHCPKLGDSTDFGRTWSWAFNQHLVGYGYNGYFLGVSPYNAGDAPHSLNTRTSRVVVPSDNILIAETHPVANSGAWSQSVWWPSSSAHPNNDATNEGVSRNRHSKGSAVLFNDGHAALYFYDAAAPLEERDPINPNAIDVREDLHSVRYWDPLQRAELGPGL